MRGVLEKVKNGVLRTDGILGMMGREILDVVFPARCVGCREEGHYICKRCEGFTSEVALICPVCQQSSSTGERHQTPGVTPVGVTPGVTAQPSCRSSRYGLDGLTSIWEYEGVIKSLLHTIKYNGVAHAAAETVQRAYINMVGDTMRFSAILSYLFSKDTCITYVPMFKKKERKRGFNQAAVFAREIGKIAGKGVVALLEKIVNTKPQVGLTKEERLQNIKNAFAVLPFDMPEKIVLVDDVWTTGATMKECCKVLRKAGAKEVWGFTLARTP